MLVSRMDLLWSEGNHLEMFGGEGGLGDCFSERRVGVL